MRSRCSERHLHPHLGNRPSHLHPGQRGEAFGGCPQSTGHNPPPHRNDSYGSGCGRPRSEGGYGNAGKARARILPTRPGPGRPLGFDGTEPYPQGQSLLPDESKQGRELDRRLEIRPVVPQVDPGEHHLLGPLCRKGSQGTNHLFRWRLRIGPWLRARCSKCRRIHSHPGFSERPGPIRQAFHGEILKRRVLAKMAGEGLRPFPLFMAEQLPRDSALEVLSATRSRPRMRVSSSGRAWA